MPHYICTEFTPEGYAINTYHEQAWQAADALAAKEKRYATIPRTESIVFKLWTRAGCTLSYHTLEPNACHVPALQIACEELGTAYP